MYDNKWFIGNIVRKSEEYNDLYISFMKNNNHLFYWPPPHKSDECWVPVTDILCLINAPEVQGSSALCRKKTCKILKIILNHTISILFIRIHFWI